MIRVFIAAREPAMRIGLRSLLDAPGLEVVGEAPSADPAEGAARADVLLVAHAVFVAPAALGWERPPAIVVLGGDPAGAIRALAAAGGPGWGVVPADATGPEIQAAVVAAARGLAVLPAPHAARLLGRARAEAATDPEPPLEPLTPREREVLELLGQGLANREIARRLGISEHTVKFHVSSIYGKLGAQSRTEAVSLGVRLGLVTL